MAVGVMKIFPPAAGANKKLQVLQKKSGGAVLGQPEPVEERGQAVYARFGFPGLTGACRSWQELACDRSDLSKRWRGKSRFRWNEKSRPVYRYLVGC